MYAGFWYWGGLFHHVCRFLVLRWFVPPCMQISGTEVVLIHHVCRFLVLRWFLFHHVCRFLVLRWWFWSTMYAGFWYWGGFDPPCSVGGFDPPCSVLVLSGFYSTMPAMFWFMGGFDPLCICVLVGGFAACMQCSQGISVFLIHLCLWFFNPPMFWYVV